VHPRHPYAGDLVYTSFAGTHQDAISKGFAAREALARESEIAVEDLPWEMPYLPMDPMDVGRTYEAVIRVNSQSGKGGISYIMETDHGLQLPRSLQIELARVVQPIADADGGEITPDALWDIFKSEFVRDNAAVKLISYQLQPTSGGGQGIAVTLDAAGRKREAVAAENTAAGPLEAFTHALAGLGYVFSIDDYYEHALDRGEGAQAAAYVKVSSDSGSAWGVGIDSSIVTASFKAALSAFDHLQA
jgi:2-isopropylmalate synthase